LAITTVIIMGFNYDYVILYGSLGVNLEILSPDEVFIDWSLDWQSDILQTYTDVSILHESLQETLVFLSLSHSSLAVAS
jgi:hypothetical protein